MFQRDYVMRIIQQFVQALLTVTNLRRDKKYNDAEVKLATASRFYLKLEPELLLMGGAQWLLDHFTGVNGFLEAERCLMAADLLYEQSCILRAKGAPDLQMEKRCLLLYEASLPQCKELQTEERLKKISDLKQFLSLNSN
ncbi:hypothetical protein [Simkania sp.]|uniref:hypothetical protein n=1 Tax=Simkania sp. TaxID=34094 RepID=UPI003B51C615